MFSCFGHSPGGRQQPEIVSNESAVCIWSLVCDRMGAFERHRLQCAQNDTNMTCARMLPEMRTRRFKARGAQAPACCTDNKHCLVCSWGVHRSVWAALVLAGLLEMSGREAKVLLPSLERRVQYPWDPHIVREYLSEAKGGNRIICGAICHEPCLKIR